MSDEQNKDTTNKEKKKFDVDKLITIAAYPISAATGLYVTDEHARNSAYEQFKRQNLFNEPLKDYRTQSSEAWYSPEQGKTAKDGIKIARNKFEEGKEKILREKGFKNMFDYMDAISRHSKNEAVIAGLTAAGISLGALLMVANSKDIFFKDNKDNDRSK